METISDAVFFAIVALTSLPRLIQIVICDAMESYHESRAQSETLFWQLHEDYLDRLCWCNHDRWLTLP